MPTTMYTIIPATMRTTYVVKTVRTVEERIPAGGR
jgi:hypothetical protein